MKHRMPVLFETEEACAGLFHKGAEEYVVLAGTLETGTQGFLIIADKLLPFAQDRALFLSILDRLNRESLSGLHQLLEHPGGVIYLYKQCQRQFEIVRKRRRNFVVFRRGGG